MNEDGINEIEELKKDNMLLVASTTNDTALACVIIKRLEEFKVVSARAIGVVAVNQLVKAVAIANTMLKSTEQKLTSEIRFVTVDVPAEGNKDQMVKASAILFRVAKRNFYKRREENELDKVAGNNGS